MCVQRASNLLFSVRSCYKFYWKQRIAVLRLLVYHAYLLYSGMLGFAIPFGTADALKNGICVRIPRLFGSVYRSTQPTDLFSS